MQCHNVTSSKRLLEVDHWQLFNFVLVSYKLELVRIIYILQKLCAGDSLWDKGEFKKSALRGNQHSETENTMQKTDWSFNSLLLKNEHLFNQVNKFKLTIKNIYAAGQLRSQRKTKW